MLSAYYQFSTDIHTVDLPQTIKINHILVELCGEKLYVYYLEKSNGKFL